MKLLRIALLLVLGTTLAAAQTAPMTAADLAKKAPTAKPGDVDTLEHILAATYDVISGPAGNRDWDRFRSLFLPDAHLTAVGKRAKDGTAYVVTRTVEEYVKGAGDYFAKNGFYENALVTKTERYGNMAESFSAYASHHVPGDKPFDRGINSFQFAFDGQRWWIVSILWDDERPDNPIPAEMDKK